MYQTGRAAGLVVSLLALYFNDQSSNFTEVYRFYSVKLFNYRTKKRLRMAHFKESVSTRVVKEQFKWWSCVRQLPVDPTTSVTRLGDLLDFRQLFKAFGNN